MTYPGHVYSATVSRPARASNWTLRQGGALATLTDIPSGGLLLSSTAGVNENVILADIALPAGAFTLVAGWQPTQRTLLNYFASGLALYETATTKMLSWETYSTSDSDSRNKIRVSTRTGLGGTPTALATNSLAAAPIMLPMNMVWFKIIDDGTTNRTYHYSSDGKNFHQTFSHARTVGPTTAFDRVGFIINPFNQPNNMALLSWRLT